MRHTVNKIAFGPEHTTAHPWEGGFPYLPEEKRRRGPPPPLLADPTAAAGRPGARAPDAVAARTPHYVKVVPSVYLLDGLQGMWQYFGHGARRAGHARVDGACRASSSSEVSPLVAEFEERRRLARAPDRFSSHRVHATAALVDRTLAALLAFVRAGANHSHAG